jgi:peroxisomal enoyl-CoA hydratase 2
MDIQPLLNQPATVAVSYNRRDLITYAVGIGCDELRFVYENDPDFAAFPTYPIVLGFKGEEEDVVGFPSAAMMAANVLPPLPGMKFVLDGERYSRPLGHWDVRGRTVGRRRGEGVRAGMMEEKVDEENVDASP